MKKQLTKLALTAALALATTLTLSCGNHSFEEWEDILFGSSSSEQDDNYSSSSLKLSSTKASSSSLRQSSDSHSGIIVGPLLQTKWAQSSPYNDLFPLVNGKRKVTDCVTTAHVQIMKFHNYPPRGKGESALVGPDDIPVPLTSLDVEYDWDNMLNEYTSKNPGTEQQRSAVATLMYHYGLARSINGSTHKAMVNTFGYDKSIQRLKRAYYSDAEWEAIIRQQLDLGLPVFYYGHSKANEEDDDDDSKDSNHGFIVDGYDNAGKFHTNVGWKGSYDGWYSLKDIDFGEGRRYNYGNLIHINIKPDAGSIGSNEMGLDKFTTSKTKVSQDDPFTVTVKIYNAGVFPGGQAGVALVNNSGNIVAVVGMINNYDAIDPNHTRSSTINCSVPYSVSTGQYNLRFVTKMNGETAWKIVTRSLQNVPNSIPFTVAEETGIKGGGWGLTLRRFNIVEDKTTASPNEEFTVDHSLSDLSTTTFPRTTSAVALLDNENNLVEILGTLEIPPITDSNRAVAKKIKCKIPSTVAPGQYKLRIAVKTEGKTEWRIVTQTDGNPPTFIDFAVL